MNYLNNEDLIPEIPGQLLSREFEYQLKREIADLLNIKPERFPGAQPVSFSYEHLQELKENNYFVCEKSDGVRCLLYCRVNKITNNPETYLIDRKNIYRYLQDIHIPSIDPNAPMNCQDKTLIDGELVIDVEPDGRKVLRYLAFDILVYQSKVLVNRPLTKRQGYLRDFVVKPFLDKAKKLNVLNKLSIIIEAKVMELSYGMMQILREQVHKLKHKSDGLIFTSVDAPYYVGGTCDTMIKWKPPNENSVDFRLNIVFKEKASNPRFLLSIWKGGQEYEQVDEMGVTSSELKFFKYQYGENLVRAMDGKIVEVSYDPENCPPHKWKFMRFREDKPHANHCSVYEKILKSIDDNIDDKKLEEEAVDIRSNWKLRDGQSKNQTSDNPPSLSSNSVPLK